MARSLYSNKDLYYRPGEGSRLKWIRRLSHLMDNSIPIPGTKRRVGLDAVIGLIPGVGDTVGGAISAYIVYEAYRLGVPKRTLLRMIYNVGVETLVGAVPIAGDVFDAAWKANTRNIALIDKHFNSSKARQRK